MTHRYRLPPISRHLRCGVLALMPVLNAALISSPLLHVTALSLAASTAAHADSFDDPNALPTLGQPADLIADGPTEQRLGQAWLRQLRGSAALWPDPLVRDYIEGLLYKLSMHTSLQQPNFSSVVIDDTQINAFAVPGGVIGVNTGLILSSDSEDELASVLSHELGHLSQRHFARSQEANQYNQWLALAGLLASIAGAAAGAGGDLGVAVGASAQAIAVQNQLRYSRAYEQEADRLGLQTLIDAGYDPRAMPAFFLKLDRNTRRLGYLPEFLLTHPLSSTRLSDLARRVADSPRTALTNHPEFQFIQVRLQVAYSKQLDELITAFRNSLDSNSNTDASRLGLSLALLRKADIIGARDALAPLLKSDPNRLDFRISDIDLDLATRNYASAYEKARDSLALFPNQPSLLQRLTKAALPLGKADAIRADLDRAVLSRPNDNGLWRLIADCSLKQQDGLGVFRSRAEYLFLEGRQLAAEDQLNNALRLAGENYSLSTQLQRRLVVMRKLNQEFR
ncbi:MAG: M48 family metalloprotease [Paraperlucidibaca sp.]